MKYLEGDKVRINSLDWYIKNKDEYGDVDCGEYVFVEPMVEFCGKIVTIDACYGEYYYIAEDSQGFCFTDEMFEGLAHDNNKPQKALVIILPEKEPDTRHMCNAENCPFYQDGQPIESICYALWSNPPKGVTNPLASICNYYDTRNVKIVEVDSDALENLIAEERIKEYFKRNK